MLNSILNSAKSEQEKIEAIEKIAAEHQEALAPVYVEIGRLYVSLHHDDHEAAFGALFEEIRKAESTVRECREAVREIRGVVCCENCGNDVPKTSAFCSVCGHAMPGFEAPVITQDQIRCAVCGKLMDRSMRFCTSCGMPLTATVPPVEEIVAPVEEIVAPVEEIVAPVEEIVAPVEEIVAPVEEIVTPVEEIVAPVVTAACAQCGQPLKDGAAFCIHCGCKAAPAAPAKRFCTNCGTELKAQARFCTGCGRAL